MEAYKCSAGVWTIGYGTTNADIGITGTTINSKTKPITKEIAEEWLNKSVNANYAPLVNKYDSIYHFTQNQFDALVSFCYNIGSIDQLVKRGNRTISEISEAILLYNKVDDKILNGLVLRRKREKELFDKGSYSPLSSSSSSSSIDIPYFDAYIYDHIYHDLQNAFKGDIHQLKKHYIQYGMSEGRIMNLVFDANFYHQTYPDLANAFGGNKQQLYEHYMSYGIKEGRQASIFFNPVFYLNNYADLRNAFGNDYKQALDHFVTFGINEGRRGSKEFDVAFYRANYSDLNNAFGNQWKQYFIHFIEYGIKEQRQGTK